MADAAEEQLPTAHFEQSRVGTRCREGLGGHLVERDAFDEVGRVGVDLEEERCFLTGAGANDGDGSFRPRGEGEVFEVDAASLSDRVAKSGDHGVRWAGRREGTRR